MDDKHDTNNNGTRNFITEGIGTFIEPMQTAFNGDYWWLELDAVSIQRLSSGGFKCCLKGHRLNTLDQFMPALIYIESDSLPEIFALLAGEVSSRDGRWFQDRYPKPRNARAVKPGTDHYDS